MIWHVIVRAGENDNFVPITEPHLPCVMVPIGRPADPWRIQENFSKVFDELSMASPSGAALDFLRLGTAAYTADVRVRREFGDDKWQRHFQVHLPVSDIAVWAKAKKILVELLDFLTGDSWDLEFRELADSELPHKKTVNSEAPPVDSVCLFSGGLDSLVGAIDRLANGQTVALVGHHGAGLTNSFQVQTLAELNRRYPDKMVPFLFGVQPPKHQRQKGKGTVNQTSKNDGESSMRARSILFFALGVAAAESLGKGLTLAAAENGLISLNVPLTVARQGSLSTRTTHPYVVDRLRAVLKRLGLKTKIEMPYRFKTKGEMLKECKDQDALAATTPLTMSCSHPEAGRWMGKAGKHCGYCVPCIIRRASTFTAKTPDAKYVVDPRKSPPSYTSRKGRDLRAFEIAVERFFEESRSECLASVMNTGPIGAHDITAFTDTYQRGMEEVARFLKITRPKLKRAKRSGKKT